MRRKWYDRARTQHGVGAVWRLRGTRATVAEIGQPPTTTDEFEDVDRLKLDLRNPRAPDEQFTSEDEVLEYLLNFVDLHELIQSILSSGWLDYEPLIVLGHDNIVLEGNRRLAALRMLRDGELRRRLKVNLDHEPSANALPQTVRIRRVGSRSDARDYIGFKHINGAFKWDALAKAKYAAEWFHDGYDIRQISRRLGDRHNTVVRLVNGWSVLSQSLSQGFDLKKTSKRGFDFSHLYTGLARPNVRRFLGLHCDDISAVLDLNPIPQDRLNRLRQLMSWLYGQGKESAVIRAQNPDLNHLVEVLGTSNALAMLESTRDLAAASDQVEDKGLRFNQSLMSTIKDAEDTLSLVGYYDGGADLISAGDNLRRTVSSLHAAMKRSQARADFGDDPDAVAT